MFVLHPSSRCDVCLEGFSWEIEMAPYAIPCGHVFCKTCLESVVPPKCPMCRKNFDPARLKKLHVDRPEGAEDPREGDLLQRLSMSFDAPEEHRRELLAEVDAWLGEKHADAAQPLRKARIAITKYQELREMGIQGKRDVAVLKQEMRDKAAIMDVEKERATAIETNLLDRARELQAQVAAAQGEIEHLRAEVQRRSQLKNPLPPPPQPISLDRYAGLGPSNAGSSQSWYNDSGRSMLLPSRGPVPNGGSYVHPRNIYPEDERDNLHESNGTRMDRKGKGRDAPEPSYDMPRPIYGPPPTYQSPPPPLEVPKPKPGIIPGASPKSKFMPPDPEFEVRERGFNAFKPPDPTHDVSEPPHIWFDPARDAPDPWSLIASALPEYANGFAEGYTNGLQSVQGMARAIPSGSRARDSDPDAGASGSDREKQERRARRRQEREKEKEKYKERGQDVGRREHRSRRERDGDGEHPPTTHRHTADSLQEARERPTHTNRNTADPLPEASSNGTRPRRGEDLISRARTHNRLSADINVQHQANAAMPNALSESPNRPRSQSRLPGGPNPPPPAVPPIVLAPSQLAPPPPNPVVHHIAQPTPRVPIQQQLEELDHSAELMQTPASRRSIQSNSTTDSWGTVSSLPHASPNSFSSLNLRSFSRQPTIPLNPQPYSSPIIPVLHGATPEEESTEDETETEQIAPETTVSARESHPSRTRRRNRERDRAATGNSEDLYWLPPPHSAPGLAPSHGSRHTQALSIPEHYQNPTLAYQRPSSTAQSTSVVIPESNARQTRNNRRRQENHQHRSRHSVSRIPSAAVIPNSNSNTNEIASKARTRRVSLNTAPGANASTSSSLSLQSTISGVGTQSANGLFENDFGYHTDVPYSGNALGLAISAMDREYTTRNRGTGGPPITAPTPIVSNLSFLRSFSYENYAH